MNGTGSYIIDEAVHVG